MDKESDATEQLSLSQVPEDRVTPVSGTPLCGAPQIPLDWQGQLAALPSTLGCWDVRATWGDGRVSGRRTACCPLCWS